MKRILFTILVIVIQLVFTTTTNAEVKLPAIISSNMVLQRNTEVMLWGWADTNEKIVIEASWLESILDFKADNNGKWGIKLKTNNSKEPQTIKIKSASSNITLENVLFGEVWLCSGQSNMYQPFKGYDAEPVYGANMTVVKSNNPNIRLFYVDKVGSKTPLKDLKQYTTWQQATPESVYNYSAIAYFFGKELQEILDCPIGLIHSSWEGSAIEPWISNEAISNIQELDLEDVNINEKTNYIPTALFNAMINPLIPFGIKGVLWYQGESNRREPEKYKKLFPSMVNDWRTRWDIGEFPIYYVQIAPFIYSNNNNSFQDNNNSAFFREAQLQCLDLIPNSGIAITMDIGDAYNIHPIHKKEVAERLLYNALNQTYGFKTIDYKTPIYDSLEVKNGEIILKFKNAESGLYAFQELENFEIAGEDKVFYPANARIGIRKDIIKRNEVLVSCDKVPHPVAVRYGWQNYLVGTLFGANLIPVSSFRTDKWDNATRIEKQ